VALEDHHHNNPLNGTQSNLGNTMSQQQLMLNNRQSPTAYYNGGLPQNNQSHMQVKPSPRMNHPPTNNLAANASGLGMGQQ
jgi:hypothetical protein